MLVVDTSVFSSLQRINRVDLLFEQFNPVIIPNKVYIELKDHWKNIASKIDEFRLEDPLSKLDEKLVENGIEKFGTGEMEVIQIAFTNNFIAAIDDLKARTFAKACGIKIIGTIGIMKNGFLTGLFESKPIYFQAIDDLNNDLYLSHDIVSWAKSV